MKQIIALGDWAWQTLNNCTFQLVTISAEGMFWTTNLNLKSWVIVEKKFNLKKKLEDDKHAFRSLVYNGTFFS